MVVRRKVLSVDYSEKLNQFAGVRATEATKVTISIKIDQL
jgi:hypothetical protein